MPAGRSSDPHPRSAQRADARKSKFYQLFCGLGSFGLFALFDDLALGFARHFFVMAEALGMKANTALVEVLHQAMHDLQHLCCTLYDIVYM